MRPKIIHSSKRRNSFSATQLMLERRKSQPSVLEPIDNSATVALQAAQNRRQSIASTRRQSVTTSSQLRRGSLFEPTYSTDEMLWGPKESQHKDAKLDLSVWVPLSVFTKARWIVCGLGMVCLLYALGLRLLKGNS